MNQQLAIAYPADYVGGETWQRRLEVLRAAVAQLNPKEVAFVLDVSHSQLLDALHERDRKVWHGKWTDIIKCMLAAEAPSDDVCADLLRRLCDLDLANTPYALTDAAPMTPEEEAAALRRELMKFGDAGRQAVDRVKKRGGRR